MRPDQNKLKGISSILLELQGKLLTGQGNSVTKKLEGWKELISINHSLFPAPAPAFNAWNSLVTLLSFWTDPGKPSPTSAESTSAESRGIISRFHDHRNCCSSIHLITPAKETGIVLMPCIIAKLPMMGTNQFRWSSNRTQLNDMIWTSRGSLSTHMIDLEDGVLPLKAWIRFFTGRFEVAASYYIWASMPVFLVGISTSTDAKYFLSNKFESASSHLSKLLFHGIDSNLDFFHYTNLD